MPRYTDEFRMEAIRLILDERRSVASVSRDLGVSEGSLHKWKNDYLEKEATPEGEMTPKEMKKEIQKLRKELKYAQEDKAILKKAVRFFAVE